MIAAVVVLVLVNTALAVTFWLHTTHGLLLQRRARRVIVTLKSDAAFTGVLFAADRDCLVLREAEALGYGARNENVTVEGEALILRADVAYIQLP